MYFKNCTTLEELKKEYHKLVMEHHPDRGGDLATMQAINAEYDEMFPKLKNVHKTKDGKVYEKENAEAPNEFKDLIEKLMKMDGVTIEVIGCFIWVSGNTKPYKDQFKELGFKWHSKKVCWYKAPADYRKKSKAQYSMDEVRDMYGVQFKGTGKDDTFKLEGCA